MLALTEKPAMLPQQQSCLRVTTGSSINLLQYLEPLSFPAKQINWRIDKLKGKLQSVQGHKCKYAEEP